MDIRAYEFDSTTGLPIVGAAVTVYTATLTHPPVTTETSGVTNSDGLWTFTGLAENTKDVKIVANGQTKWYKGKTQHSMGTVFLETPLKFLQVATPAVPGATTSFLYFKSDGLPYYRSGAAGAETRIANDADVSKNILTTRGDMLVESSAPAPTRLAVGANKTLLGSNGTDPSWMTGPTVSGSFTAEVGLNAGTTGAAAGEVKTNAAVKAGGHGYFDGQTVWYYATPQGNTVTLANGTVDFGNRLGFLFLWNNTTADWCEVFLKGGFGTVLQASFTATGFTLNSDTGVNTAIYWDSGSSTYKLRNRTAGSQTYAAMFRGA